MVMKGLHFFTYHGLIFCKTFIIEHEKKIVDN